MSASATDPARRRRQALRRTDAAIFGAGGRYVAIMMTGSWRVAVRRAAIVGGLGTALLPQIARSEVFVCPNPPSAHSFFLTIDEKRRSLALEWTTETTGTNCLQLFVDGAVAPVFQGPSAAYCSVLLSENEKVHQTVQITDDKVNAFAHSPSGGDVGVVLDRRTGIARFYAGKTLECHRARS